MKKTLEKWGKYWKNAKKNWKSQGNSSVQKSGSHANNHPYRYLETGQYRAYLCSQLWNLDKIMMEIWQKF